MSLIHELQRRNVFRVAAAYVVASWLLIEVASLLFDAFQAPAWAIQVFIVFVALGFPLALVFAWAYELTPDGIKRERDVDPDRSISRQTGRRLDRLTIAVLVAVIAILLVDKFFLRSGSTPSPAPAATTDSRSLAVLPFTNMSGDAENEYFADGITEELLNVLAGIDGLRVPSRTSSFAFKDRNLPIGDIARQLGVEHVLEGSVRKAGNRVRVTAQLIDVDADTHLWSETYDRNLEDIFAIQDDISQRIVSALQVALTGEPTARQAPTTNMQAHELYLKGLHRFRNRGNTSLLPAIEQLEQSLALDPGFVQAREALAMTYLVLPGYLAPEEREAMGSELALARARSNAEEVLRRYPGRVDALAVQALVTTSVDRVRGLALFEELIEQHPDNSNARLWFGIQLLVNGYLAEAKRHIEAALAVDPVSGINHDFMGKVLLMTGDAEAGLRHSDRALELGRRGVVVHRAVVAIERGDLDAFAKVAPEITPPGTGWRLLVDRIVAARRDPSTRPEQVAEILADASSVSSGALARAFYFIGEADLYFDYLPDGAADNLNLLQESLWYPYGQPYRQHPRFQQVAEELGLVELWRQRGWPDLCRPEGEGFQCD